MSVLIKMAERVYQWRGRVASAAFGILAVLAACHVLFGANGWLAYRQKKIEYQHLQQEVQQLQQENNSLQQHIESLKNDPKAIEKEAREQLRYAKPGEIVYVMPAAQQSTNNPPAQAKK